MSPLSVSTFLQSDEIRFDLVIFDEASGIPDSIWSVAAGFFTENILDRFWFAFSNGRRNTGYFYEAVDGSKRDFWNSRKIDARNVEGTDNTIKAGESFIIPSGARHSVRADHRFKMLLTMIRG